MPKIQIVSDLHLQFYKNPIKNCFEIIKPSAPYLALLGDVVEMYNYKLCFAFLEKVCPKFEKVIYILGNHEYYNSKKRLDMNAVLQKLRDFSKQKIPNLTILENESIVLEGVTILGTTLWSHIPLSDYDSVSKNINDYNSIYVKLNSSFSSSENEENEDDDNKTTLLTPDYTNHLHKKAVLWLYDEITKDENKPIVVFTHHAPLKQGTSSNLHVSNGTDSSYSTELSGLFKKNVKLWAFGHTHHKCNFTFRDTQVVSNPMGYSNREDTTKYENDFVVYL